MMLVDHRELLNNPQIAHYLDALEIEYKVQQLDIGDYVFGECCCERKTIKDGLLSLDDDRTYKEARKMREHYKYCFWLVSGSLNKFIQEANKQRYWNKETKRKKYKGGHMAKRVLGSLNNIVADFNINVYCFIPNDKFLIWIIGNLYKKFVLEPEGRDYSHIWDSAPYKSSRNVAVSVLRGIPNIGQKYAKLLLENFGNVKNIANSNLEEIEAINGIGQKKAKTIWEAFNND